MCWVCDADAKAVLASNFWSGKLSTARLHVEAAAGGLFAASDSPASLVDSLPSYKLATMAYLIDTETTASALPTTDTSDLLVIGDDVPNTVDTDASIIVGAAPIISTINTPGDFDFFSVELEAGKTYEIGQYAALAGPSGVPLADAFLELYDANGNFIVSADGGGPNTPSGLDALLTYAVETSGIYYINARAFDNAPEDGTGGEFVGDYELFAREAAVGAYVPYYDTDSPLHSIDWGSQVDRTSRNPDGQEGPRVTGNEFTGVGSNPYGIEGKNVITVYYAKLGDVYVSEDPTNPGVTENIVAKGLQPWELEAFERAFDYYEEVADLIFVVVDNRNEADFNIITYNGTPGAGASLLGRMSPPNEQNEGQAEFNSGDVRWTEEGLQDGGFYFPTLLHEFGHGLGMAHPHDNGGRSSIMRGAGGGTGGIGGGLGDFDLSQQVHTIMSYNDGWATSPYGQPRSGGLTGTEVDHFGWVASLSPLDIAVIQDKYGVNEEWATGDDVYTLKDVNAAGTFYESIWDAGGTDSIVYGGARDTSINLNAATLQYEAGGGGIVSYAYGVHGGFTIANGVTIENASTGSGNDSLTGNDAANVLSAGAGNDSLSGGDGADTLIGGLGSDALTGGNGADVFRFETAADSAVGTTRDVIADFTQGSDLIDLSAIGATTFVGNALFGGNAGEVRAVGFDGTTIIELDADGDSIADFQLALSGQQTLGLGDFVGLTNESGGTEGADTLTGTAGADVLNALGGDDSLNGLGGDDLLVGGSGTDTLAGGPGSDIFLFETGDSPSGAPDLIADFLRGSDRIDLSGVEGAEMFNFIGRKAFSGQAGELHYRYADGNTFLEADFNGDMVADFQIELAGRHNLNTVDLIV